LSPLALLSLLAAASAPTLVLPPTGPGGDDAWVGEAVADALPRALNQLSVPVVERADRLRAHESLEIPPQNLTRATTVRIAEALGASRLILGSYELKEESLQLSLRILDVERGSLSAPLIATGPVDHLQAMLRGLAWDIAVAGSSPPQQPREEFVGETPAVPFEALRLHARGLSAPDSATRVRFLKQALGVSPTYDEARLTLGRIQVAARESAAAVDTLVRIPSDAPLSRSARFLQGVACLDLGRYRDAEALFAALVLPEPTAALLNNYGLALLRAGPTPEGVKASDVLRKAMSLDPSLRETPLNLGWALFVEGDAEAAAFWLRGVVQADPADLHAQLALAWALRQAGRSAEADAEWKALVARSPTYAELQAPDPRRRFERAIPWERPLVFDEERWGDRQYAASHLGRAEKAQEAGDVEAARREATQAAYLDPYSERAHLLLARLETRAGAQERAVSELRMALWIRDDPGVRLELARLLSEMDRGAEARSEAQRVLAADPTNAEALALAGTK